MICAGEVDLFLRPVTAPLEVAGMLLYRCFCCPPWAGKETKQKPHAFIVYFINVL